MELFAHNGIHHATKAEAISHLIINNFLTLLIILGVIIVLAVGVQQLLKRAARQHIRVNNRRQ